MGQEREKREGGRERERGMAGVQLDVLARSDLEGEAHVRHAVVHQLLVDASRAVDVKQERPILNRSVHAHVEAQAASAKQEKRRRHGVWSVWSGECSGVQWRGSGVECSGVRRSGVQWVHR